MSIEFLIPLKLCDTLSYFKSCFQNMKPLKKKHFIFDLDDTITNSYEFNQQMFVDTFKPYLDLRNKKIQKYLRELHFKSRGTAMHLQFAEAVKNFSLTQDPEKLVDENENLHIDNIDQITIFDSTPIFFQKLKKKGRTISICTNRQVGSMSKILENNKLVTKIDNVVSCIDVGHEKPDPYCLLDLIKRSGIPKDKTIYFGDSKTDFEFAKNANVDFIIIDHYMNQKRFYTMILETFMQ